MNQKDYNKQGILAVEIGALKLKNPVMTASGTFGYGDEYAPYVDLNRLGAIIVKGLSLKPRHGNPSPRIMETPAGMLNAIGLQNVGVKSFIKNKLPYLRQFDTAIIANVYGETIEEYLRVSEILTAAGGVHALEINVSCPNVKKGGVAFGTDPDMVAEVTMRVKGATDLPVIVKLSPNVTDIAVMAKAAEAAGADAVSLINTITGMSVDVEKKIPHLKNVTGGLSGPAIKPIALRMVWQVATQVNIPVIGVGGIMSAPDALEFLIVGARAIQVGTANFIDPRATMNIIEGIEAYMKRHHVFAMDDLVGSVRI
ncbi:MAG TPA: dihydroorotate dehydrogenase [Syntrophus sp. (in: bacteria)]|jgi:dihydroorotate dehydrogenase (NAD+) catalytic subunit|nr:dihydroorotate dehydrogenase [Syntrophus sp. (in: bacteria)]